MYTIMKTIVVLPAYNAEKTLKKTIEDIPKDIVSDIILVDDASSDNTVKIAKDLGIEVICHETNLGYGGNQKTCYRRALEKGADIVIMVHPDYQYNPKVIPHLIGLIENDICDVVLANRIRSRKEALNGGMPFYKYLSNRFLTFVENLVTGENLGEWHSGMRAYSTKVLKTISWEKNSDDFVFDSQFLIQCTNAGFKMGDIPIETKYFTEASSINFIRSSTYGLTTLYVLFRYFLNKIKILKYPLLKTQ
ncbi:MAG: glycosyltransferase family 2 protein [Elusimicrobia bacterium]|nr:glycosyltransferase family 2 protein [Elusimicrobiota bacterium]